MKIKATIGHPGGDFHYFTGITGQVLDHTGSSVGRYHVSSLSNAIRTPDGRVTQAIGGRLDDGRVFKGQISHVPGELKNTDRGTIEIDRPREPSFKRNADLMVWKNFVTGEFTILARPMGKTGWDVYQGRPKDDVPIVSLNHHLVAFNPTPNWGKRVAITTLPKTDRLFFRALLAARAGS